MLWDVIRRGLRDDPIGSFVNLEVKGSIENIYEKIDFWASEASWASTF